MTKTEVVASAPVEKITLAEMKRRGFWLYNPDLIRINRNSAGEFVAGFQKFFEQGHFKIAVDLSKTEHMSNYGWRALLVAQRSVKRYSRGEIILANLPEKLRDALDFTGFTPVFKQIELLPEGPSKRES